MAVEPIQPIAFTIPDAVAYSGLSRSRLYNLIKDRTLRVNLLYFRLECRDRFREKTLLFLIVPPKNVIPWIRSTITIVLFVP